MSPDFTTGKIAFDPCDSSTESAGNDFTIGRINFGPRDSFTTLGQLIDEIAAQEELVDDLCLFIGDLITENLSLKEAIAEGGYEL